MPPKEFDCCGFAAYALGDDGGFHPADLGQTVTLSADPDEEIACNGAHWEEGDPYHYKRVRDWELKAVMRGTRCRSDRQGSGETRLPAWRFGKFYGFEIENRTERGLRST